MLPKAALACSFVCGKVTDVITELWMLARQCNGYHRSNSSLILAA